MSFLKQKQRSTTTLVKIPSNGKHQPIGNITLSELGFVEVMPMNARDEINLNMPDLLVSGAAIRMLIESCVPSVKDAGVLPYPDAQVLLLAIKRASHGKTLDVEVECPECSTQMEIAYELDSLIAEHNVNQLPENEVAIELDEDFYCYIHPFTLNSFNEQNYEMFTIVQQDRSINEALEAKSITNERAEEFRKQIRENLSVSSIKRIATTISRFTYGGEEETDRQEIEDFVIGCDASYVKKINDVITELMSSGIRPVQHVCEKCNHEWDHTPEFNPTLFFAQHSQEVAENIKKK